MIKILRKIFFKIFNFKQIRLLARNLLLNWQKISSDISEIEYISLGGWCGTKVAMSQAYLSNEATLPFDYVRSSFEGVIDCIENNFQNYFPQEIKIDSRFSEYKPFIGKYIGFYHNDLYDPEVIKSFLRKIDRFNEKLSSKKNIVFFRTVVKEDYNDEILQVRRLQKALKKKYPRINYIIIFIIPNQLVTAYYKNVNKKVFVFTLNDLSYNDANLGNEYRPIFDFVLNNNLFKIIPAPNHDLDIMKKSRLWLVEDIPMVNETESRS
jgi:hypothetical protein